MQYFSRIALILKLFFFMNSVNAATFSNMITCHKWMNLDTDCAAKSQELAGVQPYHSEFRISYDMRCDSGSTKGKPSPLKIAVEGENSQSHEHIIHYKSKSSFIAHGVGPVSLINTDSKSFSGKKFNAGCQLKITVDPLISRQTFDEIMNFVNDTRADLSVHLERLAVYQSRMITEVGAEPTFSCLINNYESNPLYAELLAGLLLELKDTYYNTFARFYDPNQYSCPWSESIESKLAECEAVPVNAPCAFYTLYLQERNWITSKLQAASEWQAILIDVQAQNELANTIQELNLALATVELGILK